MDADTLKFAKALKPIYDKLGHDVCWAYAGIPSEEEIAVFLDGMVREAVNEAKNDGEDVVSTCGGVCVEADYYPGGKVVVSVSYQGYIGTYGADE